MSVLALFARAAEALDALNKLVKFMLWKGRQQKVFVLKDAA
jgi:hypothetical protein